MDTSQRYISIRHAMATQAWQLSAVRLTCSVTGADMTVQERRWLMPNWCDTIYQCVGPKRDIGKLHGILQRMDSRQGSVMKNDFGTLWLGELVRELGYSWEKYACRGEIRDFSVSPDVYDSDNEVLTITQETAWHEQKGVRECIEKRFPSVSVYFQDEEPGCELFLTNDYLGKYFPEQYYLDAPPYGIERFDSLDGLAKGISEIVGHKVGDIDEINKAVAEYNKREEENDKYIYFHEYDIINL